MFHIQFNTVATGGSVTNLDVPALSDPSFSTRNGHFIYSEQYNLIAAAALAPTITAVQNNSPHWSYINPPQLYPANLSATVPSNPQVMDARDWPMPIPINEEFQWGVTDGASEQVKIVTWIATPSWRRNVPTPPDVSGGGNQRLVIPFTASITTIANAWSNDVQLVPANQLRGGTYAVIGCQVVAAASIAFRVNFTRQPLNRNRKLYPGALCTQTYGNVPLKEGPTWLGLYGFFNTFELPYVAVVANASATVSHSIFLYVEYLSNDTGALDQYVSQAW